MTTQLTLFDYAALDAETRIVVQQRTTEIKALMKRAASDIIEIGQKLIEVKERLPHGSWIPWLEAEMGIERTMASRFVQVAERFGTADMLQIATFAPSALYLLAAPSTPDSARQEAIARAEDGELITHNLARGIIHDHKNPTLPFEPNGTENDEWRPIDLPPDAPAGLRQAVSDYYANEAAEYDHPNVDRFDPQVHVAFNNFGDPVDRDGMSDEQYQTAHRLYDEAADAGVEIVDIKPAGYAPISDRPNYDGDEWKTPPEWIEAAHRLMGAIDLDPASSDQAQELIRAYEYYTKDENGLGRPWNRPDGTPARVWCNPPYSTELVRLFTLKAVEEYEAGNIVQALILVNNCTDTGWFIGLAQRFPVMFSRGRVSFWYENPDDRTPTRQGQAVFYLGPNVSEFYNHFAHLAYTPIGRG